MKCVILLKIDENVFLFLSVKIKMIGRIMKIKGGNGMVSEIKFICGGGSFWVRVWKMSLVSVTLS